MNAPAVNAAKIENVRERLDRMEALLDKVIMLAVGEAFGVAVLILLTYAGTFS